MVKSKKAIFLDRDGVIVKQFTIKGKSYPPRNFKDFKIYPYVKERLFELKKNYLIFVITNQPDVKKGLIEKKQLNQMHNLLINTLPIKNIYTCFHLEKTFVNAENPPHISYLKLKKF